MTSIGKADFERAADEIMARIEIDGAIHKSSLVAALAAVAAAKGVSEEDARKRRRDFDAHMRMELDPYLSSPEAFRNAAIPADLRGVSGGKLLMDADNRAVKTMVDDLAHGLREALELERLVALREITRLGPDAWAVSRKLGNGRVEYLHADLVWRTSPWHEGQSTGHFCTPAMANAAMLRDDEEERKKRASQKGATP